MVNNSCTYVAELMVKSCLYHVKKKKKALDLRLVSNMGSITSRFLFRAFCDYETYSFTGSRRVFEFIEPRQTAGYFNLHPRH